LLQPLQGLVQFGLGLILSSTCRRDVRRWLLQRVTGLLHRPLCLLYMAGGFLEGNTFLVMLRTWRFTTTRFLVLDLAFRPFFLSVLRPAGRWLVVGRLLLVLTGFSFRHVFEDVHELAGALTKGILFLGDLVHFGLSLGIGLAWPLFGIRRLVIQLLLLAGRLLQRFGRGMKQSPQFFQCLLNIPPTRL